LTPTCVFAQLRKRYGEGNQSNAILFSQKNSVRNFSPTRFVYYHLVIHSHNSSI